MKTSKELSEKLRLINSDKSYLSFNTTGQILETEFPPDRWVVDELIPEYSITAISGIPGSFKTWITEEVARCISSGEKLFGKFNTNYGPVMFIDKENHLKHIQKRLVQVGFIKSHDVLYIKEDNFLIDKDDDFNKLLKTVKKLEPILVVFDPLVRIHSGNENESKDISKIMGRFRQITNQGASVLFVHHHRKENSNYKKSANSLRGSSDIFAGIDCLLMVEKKDDSLIIEQAKLRQQQAIEPFTVKIQSNKETGEIKFTYEGEHNPGKTAIEDTKKEIVLLFREEETEEMSRQEIIDILSDDYSSGTIDKALKELV
ncbi:MAG: AAA family ATPase, partial [Candidatus Zambryskibacteria bacterium]|nr:AAA family ATPase [Candidatus Zambryskibacteria bacterium]